ncbi:MAG: NAD(P)-dependent glycerol-3-phosphate dehydrogenase [Thiomicrorhabdus sp.]|nr:NAD(P)-dependent glycerol-3-phosphate dehydrogenase [Thiomicrorhabdus sp.]
MPSSRFSSMASPQRKVAVLGAGSWGTALAIHLAKAGHLVTLWSHRSEQVLEMKAAHENSRYLSGVSFPDSLMVSDSLEKTLASAEAVLLVVPSDAFRGTLQAVAKYLPEGTHHVAWATKGFEPKFQCLLHQVAFDVLGEEVGATVLSGPTFASEVANGLPTAMVSASADEGEAQYWADIFHFDAFRMYTQTDIVGVEVGGAYKNIIAIATGLGDGLSLGANARAALISRGMVEMMRFGQALGAEAETLMGLSGLGDLVLTCTDDLSRNRRFGKQLAKSDQAAQAIVQNLDQVVEGVKAVRIVQVMAKKMQLDLPIMEQVYQVVSGQVSPREATLALLARSGKREART